MHNHSHENRFDLHVNEISFSCERMNTKTRFEKDAKENSEMDCWPLAYSVVDNCLLLNERPLLR